MDVFEFLNALCYYNNNIFQCSVVRPNSMTSIILLSYCILNIIRVVLVHLIAQSAGAVEYTDCFSAEG